MVKGIVGQMEPFDCEQGEGWSTYIEWLEQYFAANDITTGTKKVAVLLTVVGPEAYGLIWDLLTPEKPANKSYDKIVAAMKDHLNPKLLVMAELYKFHQRVQKERESVAQYLASLQKLAEKCEFGEFLDQALRDKLVCGIQNETIQRRLLTEKELTAARAYEIARGMEVAHQKSTQLQTAQQEQKAHNVTTSVESKNSIPCWRCGKSGHLADQCFFRSKQCRRCGRSGHIAKRCRQQTSNKSPTQFTQGRPRQNRAKYVCRTGRIRSNYE